MAAAALAFFEYTPAPAAVPGPGGHWLGAQIAGAGVAANRRGAFLVRRAAFAPGAVPPPLGQSLARGAATWDYVDPVPCAILFLWRPDFENGGGAVDTFSANAVLHLVAGAPPATREEVGRIWDFAGKLVGASNVAEIPFQNVAQKAGPRALPGPWNLRYLVSLTPVGPHIIEDLTNLLPHDFVLCSKHLWGNSALECPERTEIVARWKKEALIRRITALFENGGVAWNDLRALLALYLYVSAIDAGTPYPQVWRVLQDNAYDYRGQHGLRVLAVRHAR